jgi:hypothetical protein
MHRSICVILPGLFIANSVQAGMTVYDLNDVVRLRLEDISFFTVLLLACALGIRFLWNYLAKDLPRLPRLSYGKALCLTGLLSLLMLLVLSMISGARELLTPGAWRRQGSAYRLNDSASEPFRRQSLETLRSALFTYAQSHGGKVPSHDFVPDIAEKIWQSPDSAGTRYLYVSGLPAASGTNILACEPMTFGDSRFALLANGEIQKLSTSEIRKRIGITGAQW